MLIFQPKMPQMPQNLSAQFVCPSPKVLEFNEKVLHWASVARGVKLPIFAWDIYVKSCDMYQTKHALPKQIGYFTLGKIRKFPRKNTRNSPIQQMVVFSCFCIFLHPNYLFIIIILILPIH